MWPFTRRTDDDFQQEIAAHLALETERLIAEGMEPNEARYAAARQFGNVAATQERFYESVRLRWFDELRRDLRYALRLYGRSPGFAAATIVTLALGIGATSAVFTLADHMLFRTLPYPQAERLVRLAATGVPRARVHLADYLAAREAHTGFDHISQPFTVGTASVAGFDGDSLAYAIEPGFLEMRPHRHLMSTARKVESPLWRHRCRIRRITSSRRTRSPSRHPLRCRRRRRRRASCGSSQRWSSPLARARTST